MSTLQRILIVLLTQSTIMFIKTFPLDMTK